MNRREFVNASTSLAIGVVMRGDGATPLSLTSGQKAVTQQSSTERLPSLVAGVRLVDSGIAKEATALSRTVSPPYLFNHAARTFLFGSLIGRALGLKFDEEVLYLACILHDLGLTERFRGELPFEIQGAEGAKLFLEEHAYAKDKAEIVWDGIAMHASLIGHYKQAEIKLVGEGAGADVVGPDSAQIKKEEVNEILTAFPRLQFKNSFLKTCADVVRRYPRGATRSFMRDIGERYVSEFHPRNFCDLVLQAPFSE
jgi:HD domain-containing protein